MKRVLGRLAALSRAVGLGRPLAWLRDRVDAVLLRYGKPVVGASVGDAHIGGFLRHRSFLAGIENTDYEAAVRQLIEDSIGDDVLFVDVGAHVGYYSVIAARAGAQVIAVEPDPYNVAALIRNVKGLRVEVVQAAVSSEEGRAVFHPSESTIGSSLLSRTDVPMRGPVDVPTTTIDALVSTRLDGRLVLKLDVEGAEPFALAGAKRALTEAKELTVVAEVNPSALATSGLSIADITGPLRDAGLDLTFVDRSGAITAVPTETVKGNILARR